MLIFVYHCERKSILYIIHINNKLNKKTKIIDKDVITFEPFTFHKIAETKQASKTKLMQFYTCR